MRPRLLQLAVLAVLSLTVAASPIERGPLVAGIVSSVDPVHQLVRILDDAVTIDATGARIQNHRGDPVSFADIRRGAEIVAAIHKDPSSGALRTLTISILRQTTGKIVGEIEAIDLAAQTLDVLGMRIQVTPDTEFGGYVPTHDPKSLSDLRVTDLVSVQVRNGETGLVAIEVILNEREVLPEITFVGQLVAIDGDLYRISLADTRVVTVRVTPDTHLIGTPAVGKYVIVRAVIKGPSYLARSITVTDVPPPTHVRATGRMLEISATSLLIREDSNRELRFSVRAITVFKGTPRVGDRVTVIGVQELSGQLVALFVTMENPRPPSATIGQ